MEVNQDIVTNTSAIIGAIVAIVFGAQKAIKSWSADRGDIAKIGIESDLFTRMNNELKRLGDTNKAQEQEIQDLRDRIGHLLEEFNAFKTASAQRDAELAALRVRLISTTTDFDPLH
jgi:chromosome segregation ATPase